MSTKTIGHARGLLSRTQIKSGKAGSVPQDFPPVPSLTVSGFFSFRVGDVKAIRQVVRFTGRVPRRLPGAAGAVLLHLHGRANTLPNMLHCAARARSCY